MKPYDGGDPGISLFDVVLRQGVWSMPESGAVLEIGCCEADWLSYAHRRWPEVNLYGIDTALKKPYDARLGEGNCGDVVRIKRDVMLDEWAAGTLDAVVGVSSIEHVGLGHYGDPKERDGDTIAVANAWRWLKPGGYLYLDVPYDPTGYRVLNTECRIYDDDAMLSRLCQIPLAKAKAKARHLGTWYVDSTHPDRLIEKPTTPAPRYYYAASVWQKI